MAATVTLVPSSASAAPVADKDVPSLAQVKKIFTGFGKKKLPRATVNVVRYKKVATAKKVINNQRSHERACRGQASRASSS